MLLHMFRQDSYLFEGTIAENIAFGWNEGDCSGNGCDCQCSEKSTC